MEKTLVKIITQYELTKGQVKIADYIIKNQKRILGMTSQEIGKEIGVSDVSVIRFARAIGYKGFTDLKEHVRQMLRDDSEKIGKHSLYDRFVMQAEKYTSEEENQNEILQLMEANLEASLRQNSKESYQKIADKILEARNKIVVGLRGGQGVAKQFSRLLGHITNNVWHMLDEGNDKLCKLAELGPQDIVLILNFPRYYKIDEKMGEMIHNCGAYCVLITDSMASPIVKYADEILLAETEHCGFFHSMLGVEGILEYLMILMCWKEPEIFRKKLRERDAVLEEYRIGS